MRIRVPDASGDLRASGAPGPCAPEDIAPTWLAAAGYTIDERMTGAARGAPAGGAAARRLTRVQPAAAPPPAEALEGDVLDRLRSLGYVR